MPERCLDYGEVIRKSVTPRGSWDVYSSPETSFHLQRHLGILDRGDRQLVNEDIGDLNDLEELCWRQRNVIANTVADVDMVWASVRSYVISKNNAESFNRQQVQRVVARV